MYVVRIEDDEATSFRAFRRIQSARAWAVERDREGHASLVDIVETLEGDDPTAAVEAARRGRATLVDRIELRLLSPLVALQARDFGFRAARRA